MNLYYRNLFENSKKYYKSIVKIRCKALNNEWVYFSRRGFEHLIRKGGKLRSIKEQTARLNLLKYINRVMNNTDKYEYRIINNNSIIHFYTLLYKIDKRMIKIVIEQKGNGNKHFLSIMIKDR